MTDPLTARDVCEPLRSEIAVVRGKHSARIVDAEGRPALFAVDQRAWRRDMAIAAAALGYLEAIERRPRMMTIVHPPGYGS